MALRPGRLAGDSLATASFNYIGSTTNIDERCYIRSFSDIKSGHNCSPQKCFCLKFIDDSYLLIIIERTTHAKLRELIMNGYENKI